MIKFELGKPYREAIVAELSPGEQFLTSCECFEATWESYNTQAGSITLAGETVTLSWFFLTMTNINLRTCWWKSEKLGFMKGSRLIPEIAGMNTFPISEIVSTRHSSGSPHSQVSTQLRRGSPWEGGDIATLGLSLSDGRTLEICSPYTELSHLAKQLDAAKSGALLVDNTAAAANALDQLVPLLNDGILTQEEFDRAKDGFLGATVEVRESSVGLLRQLHSLHKSGVLSESEFNLKKWDILSKDG